MNILCIVDEDKFFHPQMLNGIYKLRLHKNFKIGIIKNLNPKIDIKIYLLKNIFNLKLKEIFVLAYRFIKINYSEIKNLYNWFVWIYWFSSIQIIIKK